MDLCDPEKVELVPADGWILQPMTVTFYEGESVFNVLQRTCKQQKIHMEFSNTPIYNSAYIEGIHNLYEFDVGNLSGWMYKVNGWFPNYGCSRYQLQRRRRHRMGLYLRPRLRRGRRLRNRQRMRNKDAFSGYHPTINFLYFALVLLFSMCLMHPVYLAISLTGALAYDIYLKGRKAVRFAVMGLLPMAALAALVNPAFNHEGANDFDLSALRQSADAGIHVLRRGRGRHAGKRRIVVFQLQRGDDLG